jgi:hypothetical protein
VRKRKEEKREEGLNKICRSKDETMQPLLGKRAIYVKPPSLR